MDDYPLLNLFWTMLWFFLWLMWLFLLFRVVALLRPSPVPVPAVSRMYVRNAASASCARLALTS
ncbi:hypothetical protein [Streptomyces sp. CA-132043]|uniref:hypothetical protein n=1 Tax=Streptomyces sp. CA-132043 TaxID=3240048 RepID=UPI003D8B3AC2